MIKGVIFDLDGTLLDTILDISSALNWAFNQYGYNVSFGKEETKRFIGHGAEELVIKAGKELNIKQSDVSKVFKAYRNKYKGMLFSETKPFDNVIETLKVLKEKGILLAVLSNKTDSDVQECVNYYFKDMFDYVSGQKKDVELKPHKQGIDLILDKFALSKEEVLYVGDMEVDEMTAQNAQVKFIGCNYGYSTIRFKNNSAVIDDFKEIIDYINDN